MLYYTCVEQAKIYRRKERLLMKRRALCLLMAVLMLLSAPLLLVSCFGEAKPEEGTVTRMTVDINPSVEFMVDDQNKVVSVTATRLRPPPMITKSSPPSSRAFTAAPPTVPSPPARMRALRMWWNFPRSTRISRSTPCPATSISSFVRSTDQDLFGGCFP